MLAVVTNCALGGLSSKLLRRQMPDATPTQRVLLVVLVEHLLLATLCFLSWTIRKWPNAVVRALARDRVSVGGGGGSGSSASHHSHQHPPPPPPPRAAAPRPLPPHAAHAMAHAMPRALHGRRKVLEQRAMQRAREPQREEPAASEGRSCAHPPPDHGYDGRVRDAGGVERDTDDDDDEDEEELNMDATDGDDAVDATDGVDDDNYDEIDDETHDYHLRRHGHGADPPAELPAVLPARPLPPARVPREREFEGAERALRVLQDENQRHLQLQLDDRGRASGSGIASRQRRGDDIRFAVL